jgi:hypothetical protein
MPPLTESAAIARSRFPATRHILRVLAGRWVKRIVTAILLLLLTVSVGARLRSYYLARKIQAVMRGLAELRIDQTTEEQLVKAVPNLKMVDRNGRDGSHFFIARISNESDPRFLTMPADFSEWSRQLAFWLGYRYMSFDATVLVQDGRVSKVSYGLANQWSRPQFPGSIGYIVSARSAHSFWLPHQVPVGTSSQTDESPQYRPFGDNKGLFVHYTNDAPAGITDRIFRLNLECFWSLSGCTDAREIAPAIWEDIQRIEHDTYQQLISDKCPDSIIEGRMRYLPDVIVLLLEVRGSRRVKVNEEGYLTEDWYTDYKLKEEIRGRSFGSWNSVRFRRTIPSLKDPRDVMANQIWPETKVGTQVLYFGGGFYSCRFIPATPAALAIIRNTPVPAKRPEDEIPTGLM